MPDSRPLSEITAETRKALERIEGLRWAIDRPALARLEAAHDQALKARKLLAELSGRLDGAVVLTREEATDVRGGFPFSAETWDALNRAASDSPLLCGRPGKEKE